MIPSSDYPGAHFSATSLHQYINSQPILAHYKCSFMFLCNLLHKDDFFMMEGTEDQLRVFTLTSVKT